MTGGDAISVPLFVNGGGMRGGPLNPGLADHPFLGPAWTAPRYRFYSVRDEFPALWPVESDGVSVVGELYDVPLAVIRDLFMPNEPPELELGVVELLDGAAALVVFLREVAHASGEGLRDISDVADWRAYRGLPVPGEG